MRPGCVGVGSLLPEMGFQWVWRRGDRDAVGPRRALGRRVNILGQGAHVGRGAVARMEDVGTGGGAGEQGDPRHRLGQQKRTGFDVQGASEMPRTRP